MVKITISFNIFKMISVMIEYYHIVENDHKLRIRKRWKDKIQQGWKGNPGASLIRTMNKRRSSSLILSIFIVVFRIVQYEWTVPWIQQDARWVSIPRTVAENIQVSLHITVLGPILHIAYRELTERTIVNEIYIEEDE